MRERQHRNAAGTSLQLVREQHAAPFQFHGWHGLLVQDFPMYAPELETILYRLAPQELVLIPIDRRGTLVVFLARCYDRFHCPLPDFHAQAILFTSHPRERRSIQITALDKWAVLEEACDYFSLPSREEGEQSGALTFASMQGTRLGNVYYHLPGWPDWCFAFFPTNFDRALMILMTYPAQEAKQSARVVRFSLDGSRCSQYIMQAETTDQVITRALYRHRFGGMVYGLPHRARQSQLPPRLAAPLRTVGGVVGILLALLFQLASPGFLLGMLSEQLPTSSGIVPVFFLLFGLFGACVVLLPVFSPGQITSPPQNFRKRLQRWLIGFLLAGEYSAFLYATAQSGHQWDASFIPVAGFFLWLTLTPVYVGMEIGRMFHGREMRKPREEGAELP